MNIHERVKKTRSSIYTIGETKHRIIICKIDFFIRWSRMKFMKPLMIEWVKRLGKREREKIATGKWHLSLKSKACVRFRPHAHVYLPIYINTRTRPHPTLTILFSYLLLRLRVKSESGTNKIQKFISAFQPMSSSSMLRLKIWHFVNLFQQSSSNAEGVNVANLFVVSQKFCVSLTLTYSIDCAVKCQ
jgi:hypothetical protein